LHLGVGREPTPGARDFNFQNQNEEAVGPVPAYMLFQRA
jgi:hypothetical protein